MRSKVGDTKETIIANAEKLVNAMKTIVKAVSQFPD